jgi:hypothetical protein
MRFQASQDSAQRYVYLMQSIYRLANASSNMPILATAILQILFVSLKGGALAFLAGIWATGGKNDFKESRSIALLHAAAFLEAHILEDDGIDFQTILPTLRVALQNPDQQVCQGALECISRVRILAGRKLLSVYRFDAIYGHSDSEYFNALILLVILYIYQSWAFIRNAAIFGSGRLQKIPRRSRRASRPLLERPILLEGLPRRTP